MSIKFNIAEYVGSFELYSGNAKSNGESMHETIRTIDINNSQIIVFNSYGYKMYGFY